MAAVVLKTWRSNLSLVENIPLVTAALTDWNRTVFGHITHRKRIVLARLGGVQRRLALQYHGGLFKLEKKLHEEYNDILNQEELLWFQRSREDWIVSGDRNTKYYHAAATIRKARSVVTCLRLDTGEWIADKAQLHDHVQQYYISLFSNTSSSQGNTVTGGVFPSLLQADWQAFDMPITKAEVRCALFDMAPYKALGPDGLHAAFYQ